MDELRRVISEGTQGDIFRIGCVGKSSLIQGRVQHDLIGEAILVFRGVRGGWGIIRMQTKLRGKPEMWATGDLDCGLEMPNEIKVGDPAPGKVGVSHTFRVRNAWEGSKSLTKSLAPLPCYFDLLRFPRFGTDTPCSLHPGRAGEQ